MFDFFMCLVSMSVQASIVILVVLILRKICLWAKISNRYVILLWILPFFFLIFPWKISSPIGFWEQAPADYRIQTATGEAVTGKENAESGNNRYVPDFEDEAAAPTVGVNHHNVSVADPLFSNAGEGSSEAADVLNDMNGQNSSHYTPLETTELEGDDRTDFMQPILMIFGVVWGVGLVILAGYSFFTYLRLRRKLICSFHVKDNLYVADDIATPMVVGMIAPKIYIPSGVKSDCLKHVIEHERTHILRRDPLKKTLAFVIAGLHWFNPLAWVAYTLFCKDIEMVCDEITVQRIGVENRKEYANALLSLATGKRTFFALPLAFGEGDTKARIKNILTLKNSLKIVSLIVVIVGIVLGICFLTKSEGDSESRLSGKQDKESAIEDEPDDEPLGNAKGEDDTEEAGEEVKEEDNTQSDHNMADDNTQSEVNGNVNQIALTPIPNQTFEVTLDGWGDVTFAAYMPQENEFSEGDVNYMLLQDGKLVYTFPGWNDTNTMFNQQFGQIIAITFEDYNYDGREEIIIISEYANVSGVGIGKPWNEVRVYTQPEGEKEFIIDSFLSEYLMKQGLTDSMDSILAVKDEYLEYEHEMHNDIYGQIHVLNNNREVWYNKMGYADEVEQIAVTDLDGNGRIEIIYANMGGTGAYTYSRIFEVYFDEVGLPTGLVECQSDFVEGQSQPDIMESPVTAYYNEEDNSWIYIFEDFGKNGAAENWHCYVAYSLQDGSVTSDTLAMQHSLYANSIPSVTTQDSEGNKLSDEEFYGIADTLYSDLEKYQVTIGWISVKSLSVDSEDDTELWRQMIDSYRQFERVKIAE